MTGAEIIGGGLAGIIVGGIYVVAKIIERRTDRKNGGGAATRQDVALVAQEVSVSNRDAMQDGLDKLHGHLRHHEKEEMRLFQDLREFMQAQTAAQTKICATLTSVDRRTLKAELFAELKEGE
jgi:hypothetical protein